MKKKLFLVILVVLAVLGTLLTVHLINSSKQSAEMEQYRLYLNKKYIPLTNKMNKYLGQADDAIFVSSWYDLENGFLDGQDLKDEVSKMKEELINKDAKYPDTQALKKNLLNGITSFENELETIDLYAHDDGSKLKPMIEADLLTNKNNFNKAKKIIKKYYDYK